MTRITCDLKTTGAVLGVPAYFAEIQVSGIRATTTVTRILNVPPVLERVFFDVLFDEISAI